ncbi:hypothetical protein LTR53_014149 [Teratosphaeriaceae sp. CCFEE 6253]|nr:hypothetical protein LTR53_014149 [Teratosphaeriaceae sp. CCFEE 6253]
MQTSSFINLVRRSTERQPGLSHTMATLLVVLFVLIILALFLIAGLLFMRQRRRAHSRELLPLYDEKRMSTSSATSHRRVMVRPSESIHIYQEKHHPNANESRPSSPSNEIPEIRITFPEEYDSTGKRQSGRVVVVRVGDTSIGLEPVVETLPAYGDGGRFQSVDLERVGGLVEKARNTPQRLD